MKSKSTHTAEIIPTVVPETFEAVIGTRTQIAEYPATALHVDAADGKFAANTTWIPGPGETFPDKDLFLYEAHLMVEDPFPVGIAFARAGAKRIIAHVEAFDNAEKARDAFNMWRLAGVKEVGVGILMDTPIEMLVPYAALCDEFLVMTIGTIGKQGATFDERGIERVKVLRKKYPDLIIGVDGGVSDKNIKDLRKAGASRFSVGSAISRAPKPKEMYETLCVMIS